jgi:hypothetical protein
VQPVAQHRAHAPSQCLARPRAALAEGLAAAGQLAGRLRTGDSGGGDAASQGACDERGGARDGEDGAGDRVLGDLYRLADEGGDWGWGDNSESINETIL